LQRLRRWTFDLQTVFLGSSEYTIPSVEGEKCFILEGAKITYTYKVGEADKLEAFEMQESSVTPRV